MERARATWTDERLDDLSHRMDNGFDRVDQDLRSLRADMNARFDAQGGHLGGRIDAFGAEMNARFDALQRTMLQIGGGIITANLIAIVSLLATQA